MTSLLLCAVFLILLVFRLIKFSFLGVVLLVESLKVATLVYCFCSLTDIRRIPFLIFMVVATVEVTIALVSLTRVWDYSYLLY